MHFKLMTMFAAAFWSAASGPRPGSVCAEDANEPAASEEEATRAERAARLVKMRGQAGQFEIARSAGDDKQRFELRGDPLFRYSDQPPGKERSLVVAGHRTARDLDVLSDGKGRMTCISDFGLMI